MENSSNTQHNFNNLSFESLKENYQHGLESPPFKGRVLQKLKIYQIGLAIFFSLASFQVGFASPQSQLDQIIPPEVKNDVFYDAINRLARTEQLSTILEIGSSSGEGSTEAFVLGIRKNPHHPALFCIEVSKQRFIKLKEHYKHDPFVHCYNVSSIPIEKFPQEKEVIHFYQTTPSTLNQYSLATVLGWLKQDLEYLQRKEVPQNGIEIIKKEIGIAYFDMVLIDGSEFAGMAELDQVYGAKFILLDDTCAFKNYRNRERLLKDPSYELLEENLNIRNGYSIFRRKDLPQPQ